ncbi:efflux transporter outer membrane subunit [Pseudomonas sp. MT3]|uniref:efflux transporter outer membrane subunit n=1 Tax=Pseudomonas sp. ATCC 13867 TaxID=1294143 RepID=UPI0002C4E9E5|nr:efflux transporter outer membrane subunit [Pseudomonas sp. ATCC 13867]AGI23890.1 outer membrane lipoprotein [Pseudomonas sp. ATCC 13867]RFQ38297.1 efflux transporter outer membrane subunit [Pseudomonas sp. ATCC 13867]
MIRSRSFFPLALAVALAGCAIGPDYQRPELTVPASFKEGEGWQLAKPQDGFNHGAWWELYGDATLNDLQTRLVAANQTLAQSVASYRQARALAKGARSSFFPTISADVGKTRSGQGTGSGGSVRLPDGSTVSSGGGSSSISNSYSASLGVSWELDLWGKLRRQLEADTASMDASAADLAASRLSLQSELTQDYLQLRVMDRQIKLLNDTVAAYQRSLKLTENQYNAGIVTKADVAQARTQLKSTEAQAIDLKYQRAQLEHAIAVLVGVPPAQFSLAAVDAVPALPQVPALLPSELLQRRPDVASAERQVIAANAQIGVAKAAWFPDLTLTAAGGYRSGSFQNWIETPNRYWSIGPQFAMTLFDAGLIASQVEQAEASYDQTVASYRQTVLDSFREVEDYMVQLKVLEEESGVQQEALDAAREALRLTFNQYKAGTIDYSNVVTTQTSALSNERTLLTLQGSRLTASVQLIAALGGGWDAAKIAEEGEAVRD